VVASRSSSALVEVVMAEGRKREVRRMLAAVGHPVLRLVRTGIGPVSDRRLKAGEWRVLAPTEVAALYRAAGGAP
jgi:23S rRNA pseudouridine2605 synthase